MSRPLVSVGDLPSHVDVPRWRPSDRLSGTKLADSSPTAQSTFEVGSTIGCRCPWPDWRGAILDVVGRGLGGNSETPPWQGPAPVSSSWARAPSAVVWTRPDGFGDPSRTTPRGSGAKHNSSLAPGGYQSCGRDSPCAACCRRRSAHAGLRRKKAHTGLQDDPRHALGDGAQESRASSLRHQFGKALPSGIEGGSLLSVIAFNSSGVVELDAFTSTDAPDSTETSRRCRVDHHRRHRHFQQKN